MTHPAWPLFDLVVRTRRLTMTIVREADAFELIELADRGIHDPATTPFSIPWTDDPVPQRHWNSIRHYARMVAECSEGSFRLSFALREGPTHDAPVIGVQDVMAPDFGETKIAETGSWLGTAHQGRGFGYEARVAVLALLFDGLGCQEARTCAWWDNHASIRVTENVGYETNGERIEARRGVPDRMLAFRMSADRWASVRDALHVRAGPVAIDRLAPCLPVLGITV